MQFNILYVVTLAAAAMAATEEMSTFDKRQMRNAVNAPVMTDRNGNILPFDADSVYLPSNPSRKMKKAKKF